MHDGSLSREPSSNSYPELRVSSCSLRGSNISTLIRQAFGRSGSVRAKTKLALHPLNDRRQCQAGRVLIGFAKPDILYSPIRIQRRLRRLPLYDDANETCRSAFSTALAMATANARTKLNCGCQTVSSDSKPKRRPPEK